MAQVDLGYQYGFGNEFMTEAVAHALPKRGQNPQRTPFGLYSEQLSGSAFTALQGQNLRSWLYRLAPSVVHGPFSPLAQGKLCGEEGAVPTPPSQLRWDPIPLTSVPQDFIGGLNTLLVTGSIRAQTECAVHLYQANLAMTDRFFLNSDGEFLLVPQMGELEVHTELGLLIVKPLEVAVVPRGIKFQIKVSGPSRGYALENFGTPLRLPYRGPVGASGLANAKDFRFPIARFRDEKGSFTLVNKFMGSLWQAPLEAHPLDVVAWHGNYAPYAYDLRLFNTMNTVSYDHPDPSIFTVLTSPSAVPGVSNIDFVIFPPRWMVAEDTFRPPYFHRNIMSEYMGLIEGVYDAKTSGGFQPGGGSLHNCMSAHGPDSGTYREATEALLTPTKLSSTMAFMFETSQPFSATSWALNAPELQKDYTKCWQGFKRPKIV